MSITIASGVYAPSKTESDNEASCFIGNDWQYLRVGETVTVSGRFYFQSDIAGDRNNVTFTLPILGNADSVEAVCAGGGAAFDENNSVMVPLHVWGNDDGNGDLGIQFSWFSNTTDGLWYNFSATYRIMPY